MDSERAHHNNSSGSSTGELFICFTSRFSSSSSTSSSMKISSKSILSPGRTDKLREPQISLSSSLSRRLRSNGSMKGGQSSPMFPAAGKKRGCAFENPEPSSPKVTCIGQVRVKTKKQGKKMRSRSKRRGEVSFRKLEHTAEGGVVHQGHGHHLQTQQECLPHRNQRWVHLPLTICEALRAFGAEFNCFLPCRSSCTSGEREKEEKGTGESGCGGGGGGGGASTSSCGAVFARWLVALQEGEKGREIELVVGEDERAMEGFQRRHVLDDIEIKLEEGEVKDEAVGGEEARVSICIPPKNALLLMRCRSDPMRMAALANRFWESPLPKEEEDDYEDEDEDEDEDEEDEYERNEHQQVDLYADAVEEQEGEEEEEGGDAQTKVELETAPQQLDEVLEKCVSVEKIEEENSTVSEEKATLVTEEEEEKQDDQGDTPERNPEIIELQEENQEKKEEEEAEEEAQGQEEEAEEMVSIGSSPHPLVDSETLENEEIEPTQLLEDHEEQEEEEDPAFPLDRRPSISSPPPPVPVHSEPESREDTAAEALAEEDEEGATVEEKESEKSMVSEVEEEGTATHARPDPEQDQKAREPLKDEGGQKSNERETQPNLKGETTATTGAGAGAAVLPDCLLLMMCEPKLSMEVSKETWVNSADFIRWHPEKLVKPNNGQDQPKTRLSTDSNPTQQQLHQPPRSSCSFPAAAAAGASMATMIEQKFVNAAAYEPFVLTRCKSEPMRSSAKLASDACFWKNPKLEPHRPRVGAAGVGF